MTMVPESLPGGSPGATPDSQRLPEMLQAGLDLLDQGMTVFDADLRMLAWNQTFFRLLDFPVEMGRVGTPFESFIRYNAQRREYGPGDPDEQVAAIVSRARTFAPHSTVRVRPNGRVLAVRGAPLPHRGFITLYTDITDQRRYEALIEKQTAELEARVRARTAELEEANVRLRQASAALRRSEERLRLIFDTIPAIIGYFDRNQVYHYANKRYSDWFGVDQEKIVGHDIPSVVGPKVYAALRGYLERAVRGEQVTYEYSLERDGRTHFARSTLLPEIASDGEVLGCFVLSFDVTGEKRTQAALVQAQKMEAVGQLTGGIAHDFNNMLTVVLGNLSALRDRRANDPDTQEYLGPAHQAAQRGAALIRRLLTFSRQQPLEPRPVEVSGLVQGMMKLLHRSLPETIAISGHARDEPLLAMTDPHQLENALLNLALNARDAMPEGGRLDIESSALTLAGEAAAEYDVAPGSYVRIGVKDNGTGMDARTLARAFEPFFTTKRFGSGSGLGLSMVYGFAKQSGGGVRIRSRVGVGTTVSLLLPAAGETVETLAAPGAADVPRGGPRPLVLLVEDDPEVRKVVRMQLTDLGYPVVEADNGTEAAAMIENVPDIAILVSDVVMPGSMDGRALARFARSRRPGMRVVLMSGYADAAQGAVPPDPDTPMLAKPFSKTELAALLERGPH